MKISEESRALLASAIAAKVAEDGLSFAEVARKTGVHESQVSRICRGEFKTRSHNVMQICMLLGIDLFGGASGGRADAVRQFDRTLLELWDKTPEDARRIVALLRQLADLRRRPARSKTGTGQE